MTGARITVDLSGHEEALAELAGYTRRASDKRGLFANIGMSLVTSTQMRFERGVGPDGTPWPPSIRARVTGGKTLIETARLMRSITYVAAINGLEVGTNAIYAAIHQFGGVIQQAARTAVLHFKVNKKTGQSRFAKPSKADRARKAKIGARSIRMPARPFIGLDDDDSREIIQIAEDWITGAGAQP